MSQWDFDRCISLLRESAQKVHLVADGLEADAQGGVEWATVCRQVAEAKRTLAQMERLMRAEAHMRR